MTAADILLPPVLIACASGDLLRGKIPNHIIILTAFAGALCCGLGFIISFSLSVVCGYLISGFHPVGGGDLKLAAVIIGFYGIRRGLTIALFSLIVLAGAALYFLLWEKKTGRYAFPLSPGILAGYLLWRLICAGS